MNFWLNFLAALGLTALGIILLGIWWRREDSGQVHVRGRLGWLPYVLLLIGVFYMGSTIWLGVASFVTRYAAQQTSQCMKWTDVAASMTGSMRCVYGNVYKTRWVGKSTFQILFSNDRHDFFLAGSTIDHTVVSGDCVVARGQILRSSAGVPYIDLDQALYPCESWMK
jgi:hypothetical protein